MIDLFAIGLTHALIALACLRLLQRPDIDVEGEKAPAGRQDGRKQRRHGRPGRSADGV